MLYFNYNLITGFFDKCNAPLGPVQCTCLISKPRDSPRHHLVPQDLCPDWHYTLVLPDLQMGTAETTRVLPATLPHAVTTRNTSRLVGLLAALSRGDEELLGACLFDEIHVPFRRKLVPGLEQALTAGKEAGAAGVTISGHGPGVLAFTTDETKADAIGTAIAEVFHDHSVPTNMMTLRASTTGSLPPQDGETSPPGNTEAAAQ